MYGSPQTALHVRYRLDQLLPAGEPVVIAMTAHRAIDGPWRSRTFFRFA